MTWIAGWLWRQCKGNWPHLKLILGTPSNFAFLGWHQCSSRLVTVLLGTLWSSIKQIEAPYVLIGKTQLLWTQCRVIGPHLAEMEKSNGFSRVAARTWGIFSSYGGEVHSKLEFVQWSQDTCLGMRDSSQCKLGVAGQYGRFWNLSGSTGLFFYLTEWYWDS